MNNTMTKEFEDKNLKPADKVSDRSENVFYSNVTWLLDSEIRIKSADDKGGYLNFV